MENNLKGIEEEISHYSTQKIILLGILNCEKMLRGYKIFTEIEAWGNYAFFVSLTEHIYNDILQIGDRKYYELCNKELEINCPHLDDFKTYAASYAFDVCVAFEQLLLFILTGGKDHALNVSRVVIDTVDMFIQQKENVTVTRYEDLPALEAMIDGDEFMKKEIKRQTELLQHIHNGIDINQEFVNSIRNFNNSLDDLIDYSYLY